LLQIIFFFVYLFVIKKTIFYTYKIRYFCKKITLYMNKINFICMVDK